MKAIIIFTFFVDLVILAECAGKHALHACGICYCRQYSVDCSNRGLTNMPILPKGTLSLIFNNNNISTLSLRFFSTMPNSLQSISFNNCRIRAITSSHIFQNFPNLTTFSICSNDLKSESFSNLLSSVHLSNVISLDISENNMTDFENNLNYSLLGKLDTLKMNRCQLKALAPILTTNTKTNFVNLEFQQNEISGNSLQVFTDFGMYYSKLRRLKLSYNPIMDIHPNAFVTLNNLRQLWLNNICVKTQYKGINSPSLTFLDISNSFTFSTKHANMFDLTPNLILLNISGTNLFDWTESEIKCLLSPIKSLEVLILSHTSLKKVPQNALMDMRNLITLDLSRNIIGSLEKDNFRNLPGSLKNLYLDNNLITIVNEDTFPPRFLERLNIIHLHGNKFHCSCSISWFQEWIVDNYIMLDIDTSRHRVYVCASPPEHKNTYVEYYDSVYACKTLLELIIDKFYLLFRRLKLRVLIVILVTLLLLVFIGSRPVMLRRNICRKRKDHEITIKCKQKLF